MRPSRSTPFTGSSNRNHGRMSMRERSSEPSDEMLIAQSSVLIEHLDEREKMRINDLELAIETFSATIARHLIRRSLR